MKNCRKRQGMTQLQVAKAIGISLTAYRDLEKGKTQIINDKIARIADAVGVTTEELVLGYKPSPENSRLLEEQKEFYEEKIKAMNKEHEMETQRLNEKIQDQQLLIEQQSAHMKTKDEVIGFLKAEEARKG